MRNIALLERPARQPAGVATGDDPPGVSKSWVEETVQEEVIKAAAAAAAAPEPTPAPRRACVIAAQLGPVRAATPTLPLHPFPAPQAHTLLQ